MQTIHLYDTRTRAKSVFTPIDASHVRMYVCGPTVYDFAHIGNARPIIVFDVLFRLLRHVYGAFHVTYARNVTDVDDKINLRAYERGITIRDLTDGTLAQFHADIAELGVLSPTVEPRATDHMVEMAAIIDRLIARGVAYVAEEHVLFHVPAMPKLAAAPRYGAFSRRSLDDMLAGARVDVAPYKRDPMDFVLWKPSHEPHHPGWPSPGGIVTPGRPGWHVECSAMIMRTLLEPSGGGLKAEDPAKNTFDIHGGGIDLVFPHHENEIAQSCCAFGPPGLGQPLMANVWMHNGFLQVEGTKMSKSLGNFTTIRDLLDDWPGEVLRLTMLKTHYRQPIDWTERGMAESRATLDQWYAATDGVAAQAPSPAVLAALADDLATPKAIAELHALRSEPGVLRGTLELMGFLGDSAANWAGRRRGNAVDAAAVEALIANRLAARRAKDWALSDRLRIEIEALGVKLKDGKDPTTGEPVTTWEAVS